MENPQPTFRRFVLPILLIVVSLLLIGTARILASASRLVTDARAAQAMVSKDAPADSSINQFQKLDALFTQSTQDYADFRATVGPLVYLGPLLSWIPRYGGDLANAPALFDLADATMAGAQDTMVIGRALNDEIDNAKATSGSAGVALLRVAQTQTAAIQQAKARLPRIQQARMRVDASRMSPSNQALMRQFDEVLPLWQGGLDALEIAPQWLGADRPRVYLLVAQNSDELRPTGGFITGVSLLRVDKGKITIGDFQDSYLVDNLEKTHPPAPEPLFTHMYAWQWLFRDSNWSPDFPTSALQMQSFYQYDRGIAADGVVAVNLGTAARLLEALGPVTVDPYNEQVDATNVLDRIQAYWSSPLRVGAENERWQQRKDFVGRLFEAITRRLMSGDFSRVRMGRVAFDIAVAKDVLVYLNDIPTLAGGALYNGGDDALMIVDANLGFNKVDGNISRQADYAISRNADGSMKAVLALTYTNLSPARDAFCVHQPFYVGTYEELEQGCYWDFVRIVVPQGSRLIQANTDLKPVTEAVAPGRTSFGGFFLLERGTRRTIRFEYTLPPSVAHESQYILHLEKQPGAPPVSVLVRLVVPDGATLRAVAPTTQSQQGNSVYVSLVLDRDQDVVIGADSSAVTAGLAVPAGLVILVLIGVALWLRRR